MTWAVLILQIDPFSPALWGVAGKVVSVVAQPEASSVDEYFISGILDITGLTPLWILPPDGTPG
ncbi:MAG: hypothetical protein ACK55I_12985, partial [bacterium]